MLPYVECDPKGLGADRARCDRANVRRYPTWVVAGRRQEGLLTLEDLARLSSYKPSGTPAH